MTQPVPPAVLRKIGPAANARDWLKSGQKEVDRLVSHCGLAPEKSILDIGSGNGRLASALLDRFPDLGSYLGLDVSKAFLDWCRRAITCRNPRFQFQRLDVKNERYNPRGIPLKDSVSFPVDAASIDIINAYSLFSHFIERDTAAYLKEFGRILKSRGRVFLTAYLETNVPPCTINPEGYLMEWKGPLHGVRYEVRYFMKMAEEARLKIDRMDHQQEHNHQSGLYLSRY